MLAWPRRARMPPPGRPMLPSSSWMIAARPDVLHAQRSGGSNRPNRPRPWSYRARCSRTTASHTLANHSGGTPQVWHHFRRVTGEVTLEHLENGTADPARSRPVARWRAPCSRHGRPFVAGSPSWDCSSLACRPGRRSRDVPAPRRWRPTSRYALVSPRRRVVGARLRVIAGERRRRDRRRRRKSSCRIVAAFV